MDIYKKINQLLLENAAFVTATIVDHKGSAPGKIGFKIVVENSGQTTGTVGGGAIEKKVIEESLERLKTGQSGLHEYLLSGKARKGETATLVPMSCAGRVTVFYEVHGKRPTVYVFGGGHVGQSLLYHLKPLGYHSMLIDNREEFATPGKNPLADEIIHADYEKFAAEFKPVENAFITILTHGHKYDSKILNIFYKRKLTFPYIGIIASKTKAAGILKSLRESISAEVDISPIHSPVGLNIGGTSASEIGLAIAAEIQSVRYGKG
jgi:xanthine dehydrogenase accessory factor